VRSAAAEFYRALGCLIRDFLEIDKELINEWAAAE
jgi:hypothetical protein